MAPHATNDLPATPLELNLKRNCSLSPTAALGVLGVTSVIMASVTGFSALMGAWLVAPFAALALFALAIAFYIQGRHAGDYERIEIRGTRLTVEIAEGERVCREEIDIA